MSLDLMWDLSFESNAITLIAWPIFMPRVLEPR
jgi:hypothetical protein